MDAEFGRVTIHGGWLVFGALVVVWVAMIIEARTRRLKALLAAALEEASKGRAKPGPPSDRSATQAGDGLEKLAHAVAKRETALGRALEKQA